MNTYIAHCGRKDEGSMAAGYKGGYSALLSIWVLSRWPSSYSFEYGSTLDPSLFFLKKVNYYKLDVCSKKCV